MKRILILLCGVLILSSCHINPSVMFKVPNNYQYATDQTIGNVEYRIAANDILAFSIYTNDGFKLAELDLQNRGAWEILWTMQSWESDIPLEILSDLKFLEKIQEGAKRLLEKYPNLEWLPGLKKYLEEKMGDVLA